MLECAVGPAPSGTMLIPCLCPSLVRIRASAIGTNCKHVGLFLPFLLFQRFPSGGISTRETIFAAAAQVSQLWNCTTVTLEPAAEAFARRKMSRYTINRHRDGRRSLRCPAGQ